MEGGPLSSDDFVQFSDRVVLFVHVASKVEGEKYPDLIDEKGGAGWPFVCFLDEEGRLLARQDPRSLRDGVSAFSATLDEKVKAFYDLQSKAAAGDKEAQIEFFMTRFDLGHCSVEELKKALAKDSPLDAYQKAAVHEHLVELATDKALEGLQRDKPATFGPIAKKLLAQHKDMGLPEGSGGITAWWVVMEDAYLRRDAGTFKMAFTALKAAGMRRKEFVESNDKRLVEISR